jgi:hypothetical protein
MSETTMDAVRRVLDKHRRHIEMSPGAGEPQQRYALATLDDVESDLRAALSPAAEDRTPCGCGHPVAYHREENPGCMYCECAENHEP